MANTLTTEKIVPYALLGMTAVTGLVDAVSFLSLGRVFTANMTGNIVILAFATARVSGLSIAYSLRALLSFLIGAIDVAFQAACIAGRPECFGSVVVPLIEQRIECFQHDGLVFIF